MGVDHKAYPRQFVLLGRGPWLRPHPIAQRACGFLCLGAVGVMVVVACMLVQKISPVYHRNYTLVWLFLSAAGLAFVSLWGFVARWDHDSKHQYCPDCLKYMTRGARVCPYCGLREEQVPASAAPPARHPRLSM
jgi:hypothetical protein